METKHTPGPWKVATTGRIVEVVSEFGEIAMVHGGGTPDDETMPNARLLAAAPDLLHALRLINANAAESAEWIRRHARAAIAQAEGE